MFKKSQILKIWKNVGRGAMRRRFDTFETNVFLKLSFEPKMETIYFFYRKLRNWLNLTNLEYKIQN